MIKIADGWKDYSIIATGDGYKLERWGKLTLLRPDPQVIWHADKPLDKYADINAQYIRSSSGGGRWQINKSLSTEFVVGYRDLKFSLKLMGFKHTGLFPEQSVNWDFMRELVEKAGRPISVLNLFGYTGGATVALAKSGASVCHVDAAKAMVDRCRDNLKLSGLADAPVRFIVDDCAKFVAREIKRGKRYDAVIMDPPSYGRGPNGEMWKLEDNLYDFVKMTSEVLSDNPLFFLINSYTTGLQPTVIANVLHKALDTKTHGQGTIQAFEIGLPTQEDGVVLPCGCTGVYYAQ